MNTLDIIVLGLITASGLFAFVRGFVREVLSIAAWIGAGAMMAYGFEPLKPHARELIHPAWVADLCDAAGLFILSLLAFSLIVGIVARGVRASGLSAVDRALGLLFGLGRAAVLLCLSFLILSRLFPPASWPSWAAEARSLPLLAMGGEALKQFIPHQMLDDGVKAIDSAGNSLSHGGSSADLVTQAAKALDATAGAVSGNPADPNHATPAPAPTNLPPGYDAEQIREMNRAVEQAQGAGKN